MPHCSTLSKTTRSRGLANLGRTTPRVVDNLVRSDRLVALATRSRSFLRLSAERALATISNLELPRFLLVTLHAGHGLSVFAFECFWFVHALCIGESRLAVNRPLLNNAWGGGERRAWGRGGRAGAGKVVLRNVLLTLRCTTLFLDRTNRSKLTGNDLHKLKTLQR